MFFKKNLIFFIFLILFLAALRTIGFLKPLENSLIHTLSPLTAVFYSAGSWTKNFYLDLTDKNDQHKSILQLEKENKELILKNSQLKTLQFENNELRKYLNFFENNSYSLTLTRIVSRPNNLNQKNQQIIILNKGLSSGLRKDLPVISTEGILIGKIISCENLLCKACLAIDSQCRFAVAIQNENRTIGMASGNLGLTIKMELIPQTEKLKLDDFVVSSGLEETIPANLFLGKISEINKKDNEIWQTATIEPIVDYDRLDIVGVITN